jgi:hypothetical protein
MAGNELARVRLQCRRDQIGDELPITRTGDKLAREELQRPKWDTPIWLRRLVVAALTCGLVRSNSTFGHDVIRVQV